MSSSSPAPAISGVLPDGALFELLYDPVTSATAFAVAHPDGPIATETSIDGPGGERLIPYSPHNNLITSGCVLLPSDIGDFGDKRDLVGRVQAFLHRYVDLTPSFEEIAAYYILLTWLYDRFNDLPYLRLRGAWGSGKTRGLLTIGSLCYKPFFASGASTVSPIFHIQDAFQGTLILDEADYRFSDATSELTKILNNGTTRGLPVLRTMTNRNRELNPTAFRVFGPKVVAMRESFSDQALESRFLTEHTSSHPPRPDIPIHLPDTFAGEALALRNDLLAWRLRSFHTIGPDLDRVPDHLSPRTKQMALALLSLIDDEDVRDRVCAFLGAANDLVQERHDGATDTLIVRALEDAVAEGGGRNVPVAEVAERFNRMASDHGAPPLTNKRVGWLIRDRLGVGTMKSGGVYVIPPTERGNIDAVRGRLGIE